MRCQNKVGYLEQFLYISERFRHTRKPLHPGASIVSLSRLYEQIHFFSALARWEDRVLAGYWIRGQNRYGLTHC